MWMWTGTAQQWVNQVELAPCLLCPFPAPNGIGKIVWIKVILLYTIRIHFPGGANAGLTRINK